MKPFWSNLVNSRILRKIHICYLCVQICPNIEDETLCEKFLEFCKIDPRSNLVKVCLARGLKVSSWVYMCTNGSFCIRHWTILFYTSIMTEQICRNFQLRMKTFVVAKFGEVVSCPANIFFRHL
jgi:hypothetical protein